VVFALTLRPPSPDDIPEPALEPYIGAAEELAVGTTGEVTSDVGRSLQIIPGVDAIRRGGTGFDPLVRGLAETNVAVFVDGARHFAADPFRADPPTSHFDAPFIDRVEIIKGPFALTRGAGALSAISLHSVLDGPAPERLRTTIQTGHETNRQALETAATVRGGRRNLSFGFHGAFQRGDDYESGNGATVPAHFRAWNARGRAGYRLNDISTLSVAGGHQRRDQTDEPALPLGNAISTVTDLSGRYALAAPRSVLRSFDFSFYWNRATNILRDDGRFARACPAFIQPPEPLGTSLHATLTTFGGRAAGQIVTDDGITLEVGTDFFETRHRATLRTNHELTGALVDEDRILPRVRISDIGLFLRGTKEWHRVIISAATRLDLVTADAASASVFFLQNAAKNVLNPDRLDRNESNLSLSTSLSFPLSRAWTVSTGLGSIIRTANAFERYADRFPSSRSFRTVEVLGRPDQEPVRATEVDLSVAGRYPNVRVDAHAFSRPVSDYTTFLPTDLPSRDSTDRVFRYRNGEGRFRGAEAAAEVDVPGLPVTVRASGSYLWGKDVTLDEPAFGVSPARANIGFRYRDSRFLGGATVRLSGRQNRVSIFRDEPPTRGYATADVFAGIRVERNDHAATVSLGIDNVLDRFYTVHTSALDAVTQVQLSEPGRSFYVRARFDW